MKKLFLTLILFFCLVGVAFAQNPLKVIVPNQSTIEWEAVTILSDGTPIPTGEVVTYQIFLGPYPIPGGQDPNDAGNFTLKDSTSATTSTINFDSEGVYLAGVRAVRTIALVETYSDISWSSDPIISVTPWYYVFITPYAQPTGLHKPE